MKAVVINLVILYTIFNLVGCIPAANLKTELKCYDNKILIDGKCVKDLDLVSICQGPVPNNATACNSDLSSLNNSPIDNTLVSSCVNNNTKCKYQCNDDYYYAKNENICIECSVTTKTIKIIWQYNQDYLTNLLEYELYSNLAMSDKKKYIGPIIGELFPGPPTAPPSYQATIEVNINTCSHNYFYLRAISNDVYNKSPYSIAYCLGNGCSE